MYELLLVVAVLLFCSLKYRETFFVVKYGNPFNDEDAISFDPNAKGSRAFGFSPYTCPTNKPELDAGLCYEQCEDMYHGVGPLCWANTINRGIGIPMKLLSCPDSGYPGWTDTGLLCNEPISCAQGWEFFTKGCSGGRIMAKRLTCSGNPEHKDEVDALCYKPCPSGMRHVPGMPYLCFKGTRGLSYGRGVGEVPPLFAFGE